MWQLYLGVILFAAPHLFSTLVPNRRDNLKLMMGEVPYKLSYAMVSLIGVGLLAWAYVKGRGDGALLYEPWYAARHVAMLLIFVAFLLIFSNGSLGHVRKAVKHPFSIGIVLWSVAHLMLNGEPAVVVLFATFLVVALADVVFSFARGKIPQFVPNWKHDLRGLVVGTLLFIGFATAFHSYVLGVRVVG